MNFKELNEYFKSTYSQDELGTSFMNLDLPHRKMEAWKYVPVSKIKIPLNDEGSFNSAKDFIQANLVNGIDSIVIENGKLNSEISNFDSSVWTINDEVSLREDRGDFWSQSSELLSDTQISLQVTEGKEAKPLQILNYASSDSRSIVKLVIEMEKNATACVYYKSMAVTDESFSGLVSDFNLAAKSKLQFYKNNGGEVRSQSMDEAEVNQAESSVFEYFQLDTGFELYRSNLIINLDGEKAESHLKGFYLSSEHQFINHHIVVNHNVPHTHSTQLFKGILDDTSRVVFDGLVYVGEGSVGTDSEQLNKSILLTNFAEIVSRPQLEIYNDDVTCAHGATMGSFDEDELFYLQARAIPRDQALQMLALGYAEDVISFIEIKSVHDDVQAEFLRKFKTVKVD
ncbi:MAG: SufD family Fe-S cluster assembly protein [Bdellovibrionales bacterium]